MHSTGIIDGLASASADSSNVIPIAIFGSVIGLIIAVCLVQVVRILMR